MKRRRAPIGLFPRFWVLEIRYSDGYKPLIISPFGRIPCHGFRIIPPKPGFCLPDRRTREPKIPKSGIQSCVCYRVRGGQPMAAALGCLASLGLDRRIYRKGAHSPDQPPSPLGADIKEPPLRILRIIQSASFESSLPGYFSCIFSKARTAAESLLKCSARMKASMNMAL